MGGFWGDILWAHNDGWGGKWFGWGGEIFYWHNVVGVCLFGMDFGVNIVWA